MLLGRTQLAFRMQRFERIGEVAPGLGGLDDIVDEAARRRLEMRLEGLTGTMADLEARVLELTRSNAELAALINLARAVEKSDGHVLSTGRVAEEVAPETLVMIAAAVTSYLGKPVRIRSAKMLQSPYEIVNPWAQQGRVFVQASHVVRPWNRPGEARGGPMTGVRR